MKPSEAIEYLHSKGVVTQYQTLRYLTRKGYIKSAVINGRHLYTQADIDNYLKATDNGKVSPSEIYHFQHHTLSTPKAREYITSKGLKTSNDILYKAVKHNRLINSGDKCYAFTVKNLDSYIVWLKKYKEILG